MAYFVNDDCIMCEACIAECPEEAITMGDDSAVIDPKLCKDHAACVEVCPVDAIHKVEE
ncbi:MAG: 4Fe-4S binding protein [Anaerolineaceae bacterium]|jgi:ferredoxin|nr:4Fe-4S binding protein [Anaerolineaceae bacterium]